MKLFLSYPSAERTLADRLALALEAEGHTVFFDRTDLPAGDGYHQRLRQAIAAADAMVCLVTPAAVASGSYTLAEWDLARERWRQPAGHVLPVMVPPTPMAALPPYLAAVTVLQPVGETVAETVAAVARLAGARRGGLLGKRAAFISGVAVLLIAAAAVLAWRAAQHRAEQAAMQSDTAAGAQALALCNDGRPEAALQQLNALAAHRPLAPAVITQREDCAMHWVREMRSFTTSSGQKRTFDEQLAIAVPILLQGLPAAKGTRAADLLAHVGWGDRLRWREGSGSADPVLAWQRALAEDAGNVYAHAMWGFQLIPSDMPAARPHFSAAVASGRERAYVRRLQFGASLNTTDEAAGYALTVADEMRRNNEAVAPAQRERLWNATFGRLVEPDTRAVVLAALPPAQLKATFDWLFTGTDLAALKSPAGRFAIATVQARTGQRAEARAGFESLLAENKRTQAFSYQVVNAATQALAALGKP